jgi:signal transduction histidine kinase
LVMLSFAKSAWEARRAWIGVGVPILTLVAVIIILAVATFASFARDQDKTFEQSSTTLVASGLQGRARAEGNVGLDYANWQEMFDNVSVNWNQTWIEDNIYSSVAEGMILFRADGAVRYRWFDEKFATERNALTEAAVHAAIRVPNLRRLARAATIEETVAYTYARLGDQLIVIAVMPVTPEGEAERLARNPLRGYDYLAVVEIITAEDMARASVSMSLQDFRFTAAPEAPPSDTITYPVTAADGTPVGQLQWRHAHPGAAAFQRRIWPVVLGLLLIGALTLLIARRLVSGQVGTLAHAEAALEASRLKSEFLARVGHELRTPLNGIIGYAEIIQEENESPTTRADAERIVAAARHLNHLLSDILDQSRIDAGRIKFNAEVLPVAGMLSEVQGLMRPSARTAAVTLHVQPCATANYVFADHVRLRQCLLNLVGNAIKFAPRGNVTIKTRVDAQQRDDMIVFDIIDDGIGIAKGDLPNLFQPFSQANSSVGETYGGTGLGLSISRELARGMGGDVTVTSELGKGSTFSLSVPVASAQALCAA